MAGNPPKVQIFIKPQQPAANPQQPATTQQPANNQQNAAQSQAIDFTSLLSTPIPSKENSNSTKTFGDIWLDGDGYTLEEQKDYGDAIQLAIQTYAQENKLEGEWTLDSITINNEAIEIEKTAEEEAIAAEEKQAQETAKMAEDASNSLVSERRRIISRI